MRYFMNYILALTIGFSLAGDVWASDEKFTSTYAVHQQQGPVCPYLPWVNLQKIRNMRARDNGQIVFQNTDFTSKINSYSWFLPRIHVLDRMYDDLRGKGEAYAEYENMIRETGIKEDKRFDKKGYFIEKMDWNPLDQARRPSYSPYNMKEVEHAFWGTKRWLPIFQSDEGDKLYFYDHNTRQVTLLESANEDAGPNSATIFAVVNNESKYLKVTFTEEMLNTMGVSIAEIGRSMPMPFAGFKNARFILASSEEKMNREYFYDVGTYQHMLFACGVKSDNTLFAVDDQSLEARAFWEYRAAVTENPLNPWCAVNKEDLFEYHLAEIFKNNPVLKAQAMESVNYYNDCWKFYTESFDLYDSPSEPRTKFSAKQRFLPGEDQMLAYYFSSQLRFLWAASISINALIDVEELKDNLGETLVKAIKMGSWAPGVPSVKKIIAAAEDKKFGARNGRYSFLDAWAQIKKILNDNVIVGLGQKDFISFSSHGCVISFDDNLIQMQGHGSRDTAQKLGFEMWDSYYDKGLAPFYRRSGTEDDVLKF